MKLDMHTCMHYMHSPALSFFMILLRNLKPNMRNKNQMQCCDCRLTLRLLYIHIGRVSFLLICYRGCWHVEVVHTNLLCLRNVTKVLLVLIFHSININHSILEYFVLCDGSAAISLHHVLVKCVKRKAGYIYLMIRMRSKIQLLHVWNLGV